MDTPTNPTATGGSGPDFEFKVGAVCLTLLLTGGAPMFLEMGTLRAVRFQTGYLGWKTEDLLLEAVNEQGLTTKAAIQVKLAFTLSEKDEECVKTLRRAFADFRDTAIFDHNRDVVGLVTGDLSARLVRGLRSLLDCARAATGSGDMVQRLSIPAYLGKAAHNNYRSIVEILQGSDGPRPTDEEIWRFLTRFNVVSLDLNVDRGSTETMVRSLLAITTRDGNPSSADATWNELRAIAASKPGSAASFTFEKLPEHLRQRHDRASGFPAGITRLLKDTQIVLKGIRTTIGGQTEIPRRALFAKLCLLIEENPLVFVTGEAGSGKSVLAKMGFLLATQGSLGFAFRAESLAGTHINEVLGRLGLTLDGLCAQTSLHGRKILWIESLERLMEKDAEQRTAFLDLLRAVKSDPTWKVVATCRDYSAETVKSAFFGEAGLLSVDLVVPELNDAELDEVTKVFPGLRQPMSSAPLRRLLCKPFLLDKAVLMQWPATEPLPQHERAFREKVWQEVVRRPAEGQATGLPRLRSEAMVEVALRRAKAMEPFVAAADLDPRALHGLVRDSLLTVPASGDDRFAPAHDVFEDWALAVWLESEFERGGRRLDALFLQIGTYPALRRAFRKWLTELLDVSPQLMDALVIDTIRNSSVAPHWRDDTLVGVLLSADASAFLGRNAALLNADNARLLRQVIHLLHVACKAAMPASLFGIEGAGDVFLPRGAGWKGAAELTGAARSQFGETDFPFVLGFMEDWVRLTQWGIDYPGGAKAIAMLALHWLPRVHSRHRRHRDDRQRLFKILLKIPRAAEPELSRTVAMAIADKDRTRDNSGLIDLIFSHFHSDAVCRDMPALAIQVAEHELGLDRILDAGVGQCLGDDINEENTIFGLGHRLSMDDFPASAFSGPFLRLLQNHAAQGCDFILRFANRACEAYAYSSSQRRGVGTPLGIKIRMPNGSLHEQYADGVLWGMYRGTAFGPNTLKSALMALERWLLEKGKRGDADLADILLQLLIRSNNIAVTAVVASVAVAYPNGAGLAAITVLTNRYLFRLDLERAASEAVNLRLMGGGLWPDFEKRLCGDERATSARLPHRREHLEMLAVALQGTGFRDRVWAIFDAFKSELSAETEQDEGTRVWRFRLHQMDVRTFVKVGETEDGRSLFQASPPPSDLQAMLDEHKPRDAAWEAPLSLFVWGAKIFEGERDDGVEPDEWKKRLAEARTQLDSDRGLTERVNSKIARGGAEYVAAVCIRDHWAEMDEAQKECCMRLSCDSIEADANSTDRLYPAARNPTEAANPAAFILSALFGKQLPAALSLRLLPVLARSITHPVGEVVASAVRGVAEYLWKSDRSLALTCVHALIIQAIEQNRFWSEQRLKPLQERLSSDEFDANLRTRLRGFVEMRESIDDSAILRLDLTDWPGRQVAAHLFAVFGEQPTDPLAVEFFKRSAATLAARWVQDDERRRSRDEFSNDEEYLAHEIEHQFVDTLAQFVLKLPPMEAAVISEPLFLIANRLPEKAAEFVKWLITRQDEQAPATTLWFIWQRFADDFSVSSLPASVDDEHSDSSKLLRELFLGENWGESRDWKPLLGEKDRVRALFDQLPASRQAFEAYAYFLAKIGSPSLPDPLRSVAAKIPATKATTLFSETTVFYFETILTRLIYGGNREIRIHPKLREGTMLLLDVLVAAGSSVAYKLRDDFLTPPAT